jgi:hypothetical protein
MNERRITNENNTNANEKSKEIMVKLPTTLQQP